MNVETGKTYPSLTHALDAGEHPEDIVEVQGTPEQVQRLSGNVAAAQKAKRRAANKRARASRKRNR